MQARNPIPRRAASVRSCPLLLVIAIHNFLLLCPETQAARSRQKIGKIEQPYQTTVWFAQGTSAFTQTLHCPFIALEASLPWHLQRPHYHQTWPVERGWLSANSIVFQGRHGTAIVDTGYHSHGAQTVEMARRLLLDVLALGLPVGTEFLDLLSPQFISDLVSWGAIGARTTESQSHRQLASGLSCPVGFKNGTDGGVKVAVDAIVAAQAPHAFMGMTKMGQAAIFETRGNEDCHVILRGGRQPNYGPADVDAACQLLQAAGLRAQVMIDVSHANSLKQHQRQIAVAAEVAQQVAAGDARIMGVMIESHLHEGRQDIVPGEPLRHGVSVTDACIGWAQTVPVLRGLADAVRARRAHKTTGGGRG